MPDFIAHVRRHAGVRELSLHGWSIGGVISLGYAAHSRDPDIRNLVILGSPIHSHASGALGRMYQQLSRQAAWVRRNTGFRVHNLNPRLLHTPGWVNALSFKMLSPVNSLLGYWELLTNLDDREFVINHATNGAFLENATVEIEGTNRISVTNGYGQCHDVPNLLIPAVQVNIRAGRLPPAEDNGVTYLKIPLNKL